LKEDRKDFPCGQRFYPESCSWQQHRRKPLKASTLAWASSSGPNLAGYRVHEGTSSGTYTQTLDVGNRTTATISNLTAGVTYHFVVSAYNAAGVESAYSNEVAFTAPGVLPFNFVPGRDLVWRNTATGQVGLWIMNGTKIAQSPIIGSASLDWQIIGTGNFTGNPGILWVNSNTGQLGVWSVNGAATPGVATWLAEAASQEQFKPSAISAGAPRPI
jgi:Fibronectin type III domain